MLAVSDRARKENAVCEPAGSFATENDKWGYLVAILVLSRFAEREP